MLSPICDDGWLSYVQYRRNMAVVVEVKPFRGTAIFTRLSIIINEWNTFILLPSSRGCRNGLTFFTSERVPPPAGKEDEAAGILFVIRKEIHHFNWKPRNRYTKIRAFTNIVLDDDDVTWFFDSITHIEQLRETSTRKLRNHHWIRSFTNSVQLALYRCDKVRPWLSFPCQSSFHPCIIRKRIDMEVSSFTRSFWGRWASGWLVR